MASATKPKRLHPAVAAFILIAALAVPFVMSAFGHQIDNGLPSWFLSQLTDRNYLAWHRWWPILASEALAIVLLVCVPALFAYYQIDAIYHAFHNNRAALQLITGAAVVPFLLLFVYAPLTGGYAIYTDHLVVLDPFRDLKARTITIGDIDHIETGCHERIPRGRREHMRVPSYRIVLHDGRVVSLFDLADERYEDDRLMRAVLAFDAEVQARHIPKRLRRNVFDMEMGDNGYCYSRMEGKFDRALVPAIRRTFEGG